MERNGRSLPELAEARPPQHHPSTPAIAAVAQPLTLWTPPGVVLVCLVSAVV